MQNWLEKLFLVHLELPSQRIDRPSDIKGLKIPYPVVLKSQVRTGGRGRAGGVKFVENTIDAIAAAQTIFHCAGHESFERAWEWFRPKRPREGRHILHGGEYSWSLILLTF